MKVIYKKAIEINNDIKLKVDDQKDDIKQLKEKCDIYDEDEVHEITATRNPLKKNRAMYVTYNKTFAMKNGLKKHIQEKHTELW